MQHRGKNADVVLPEEFLGGSAPLLQSLSLWGIAYRGILNLMLSTNHLHLFDTPHSTKCDGHVPLRDAQS